MPTTVILSNGREVVFSDDLSDEEIYRRAKQMDEQQMREQQAVLANPNAVQPRSAITGMTPDEAQSRGAAGLAAAQPALSLGARIVGPVAAAIAAPALVPAGVVGLGATALTSGIAAGGSMTSEFLAQTIEQLDRDRVKYDPKAIAASGVASVIPMKQTGSALARLATNVPTAVGGSELARFIAMGEDAEGKRKYTPAEDSFGGYALRYGLPVAFAGAASLAGATAARSKEAEANIAAIQSGRGPGSRVALSEAIPGFAEIERAADARGSVLADQILSDLDAPLGPKMESYFRDIPDVAPIRESLMAKRDLLSQVENEYNSAKAALEKATADAAAARAATGRDSPALVAKAELAAFQATAAKFKLSSEVTKQFKGVEGRTLYGVSAAVRDNNMRQLVSAADKHMESSINEAYQLAGYTQNSPVVSLPDIIEEIDLLAKDPKSHLSNNLLRSQMKEIVQDYVLANKVDGDKLDLLKFRQLRNSSRDALIAAGMSEGDARAIATDAYGAVARAADRFISNTNPSYFPAWSAAQSLAKSRFAAMDTPTFQLITADPKIGAQISNSIYSSIKEGGVASQVAGDVRKIATTIAATYDQSNPSGQRMALEAADNFVNGFNSSLADAAFSQAKIIGKGSRGGFDAFDLDKLAAELDTLDSVGFSPQQLGIGTSEGIRSYAKVLSSTNGIKTVTQKELNDFLDAASVLGADRAAWRMEYKRALRDNLIASGAREKGQAAARMAAAERKAGISMRDAEKARNEAMNDPLVRMFEDSNFKLASDPANNANWVSKILTMPKESISRLTNAFKDRGDFESLENLRIAAAASVMRQYESATDGTLSKLKLQELNDFFYKKGAESEKFRQQFIALVGNDEFNNLERAFGKPIQKVLETSKQISSAQGMARRSAVAIRPRQKADDFLPIPKNTSVTVYGDLKSLSDMVMNGRYNTLYKMYVDPKWAPKVKAAGGALNTALTKTPSLGMILNVSRDRDDRNNRNGEPGL
jgi:hypothetical protein